MNMIAAARPAEDVSARSILEIMEVQLPGRRNADGSVSYSFLPPLHSVMFGPFLRLAQGHYCLEFDAIAFLPLQTRWPIVGVEVIAQNRLLRAWQDFTADELSEGTRKIYFEVPEELGIERGGEAPFEFRFTAFGTSGFTITSLVLRPVESTEVRHAPATTWRMLGRMRLLPLSGAVRIAPLSLGRWTFGRPWTSLYLPSGTFRLDLKCRAERGGDMRADALDVSIVSKHGQIVGSTTFSGGDLLGGTPCFLFEVPVDLSLESGSPQALRFRFRSRGRTVVKIDAADISRLGEPVAKTLGIAVPARGGDRRARVIIFGNCQGSLLANAFRSSSAFAKRFAVTYHSMELPGNLHEQGKRDLDDCDILLIQDIREWEQYPLRHHVPDSLQTLRYPCVRFASPWPFDAFNGPDDRQARNKDFPNFEFTYFDGLLARLRREIPDPEARFEAYRSLDVTGLIDPRRLHAYEEKRLLAMDEKFSTEIGAYILENFRRKRVFYTTAHPNGAILGMLLRQLGDSLGVRPSMWSAMSLDSLRHLQVPIHPKVAKALDLKWAGPSALYRVRGQKLTWEAYFRRYISYYG